MKNSFSTPGFLWPLLTLMGIIVILYGLHTVLGYTTWEINKKKRILWCTALFIIAWMTLLTILSVKGIFADFTHLPPRPVLALLLPMIFIVAIAFSKTGSELLMATPPHWLIFFQSFRIIVELLLWFAFMADQLPVQMTFDGKNLDVLTGIIALPAGYLIWKNKSQVSNIIPAFNILGIILLLNILIIAVLSMPTPFRYFMNEPSDRIIAQFPFILLPGVLVPMAYSFHIFSLRQWFLSRS